MSSQNEEDHVAEALRSALNLHGYGFQYAAVRRAHDLAENRRSLWRLTGTEFPVTVGGQPVHIDFVLHNSDQSLVMVAECKRVEPSRARWTFARSPYTWRSASSRQVILDEASIKPGALTVVHPATVIVNSGIYHIGLQQPKAHSNAQEGGKLPSEPDAINQAVSQALRGTSGLINQMFTSVSPATGKAGIFRFIPAVFTTAELWVTDADLAAADLSSGKLGPDSLQVLKVPWLWFNHHRSSSLWHNLSAMPNGPGILQSPGAGYARSVAVVGPDGIDDFLGLRVDEMLQP